MDYQCLGSFLRAAREQSRMTQTEAAEALRVTSATLSQYEAGKRRVDALMLDRLARLYGVPISYFYGEPAPKSDWEEVLRLKADGVSLESKVGIGRLIEKVHALEELYLVNELAGPERLHPPFAPLPECRISDHETEEWAEKTRRHYDLGLAPLPDLRGFLDAQGYRVFTVPFGAENREGHLSGLSFSHASLGPVVAINENQPYGRRPFTLAHELAHRLFHYDRPAVLSRAEDVSEMETLADRFAAHFLIPREALHERIRLLGVHMIRRPQEVVHLARYFGVGYQAMRRRLKDERRLADAFEDDRVKPLRLARTLGYPVSPYECRGVPLAIEEKVPRIFLELAGRAIGDKKMSVRRAAEMMGISHLELEELLDPDVEALEEASA